MTTPIYATPDQLAALTAHAPGFWRGACKAGAVEFHRNGRSYVIRVVTALALLRTMDGEVDSAVPAHTVRMDAKRRRLAATGSVG